MSKQEIINIIKSSMPVLETRYGVKRLGLFGSYVREQQRRKSDIDLLVSFNHEIDLFEFLDLREFLVPYRLFSFFLQENNLSQGTYTPLWGVRSSTAP